MKILTKIVSFVFELIFFVGITIFGISFLVSRFFNQNYYTQVLDSIDIKEKRGIIIRMNNCSYIVIYNERV